MVVTSNTEESTKQKSVCSSPPPRCSPPPSMNSFTIPKRTGLKELFQPTSLDSRECKEVINAFHNSLWDPQSYTFEFKSCQLVNNEKLEEEFKTKRKEMGKEIKTGFAYLRLYNQEEAKAICENGLSTISAHNSTTGLIGDHRYGVYLCRCADIISRRAAIDDYPQSTVIVFKVLMGRLRLVDDQKNSEDQLEPTPDFDGHISKGFQRGKKRILSEIFESSQIYFYEINLDNISNDDDAAIYSKRPRQCLPFAVLTFEAKRKLKATVMTPVRLFRSDSNTNQNQAFDGVQTTENPFENFKNIKYIWSGCCYLKEHFLADVQLGMYNEKQSQLSPLPVSANLCVSQKITFEKLSRILPSRIFRKKPCESQQPASIVEGFHFLHTELYPIYQYETKVNSFHRQLQLKKEAGVCTLNSGMKLYILPTSDFTESLGITSPLYPAVLHCLFMQYKSVEPATSKTDYEYFIKQSAAILRDRASENEELKLLNNIQNIATVKNLQWSYKLEDRIKVSRLLSLITKVGISPTNEVTKHDLSKIPNTLQNGVDKNEINQVSQCTSSNHLNQVSNASDLKTNSEIQLNKYSRLNSSDNDSVCSDDLILDVEDACCDDPICKDHLRSKPKLFKGHKKSVEEDDYRDATVKSILFEATDSVTGEQLSISGHTKVLESTQQTSLNNNSKIELTDNQRSSSIVSNNEINSHFFTNNNKNVFPNNIIHTEIDTCNNKNINELQNKLNDRSELVVNNTNVDENHTDVQMVEMSIVDEYVAEPEDDPKSNELEADKKLVKINESSLPPSLKNLSPNDYQSLMNVKIDWQRSKRDSFSISDQSPPNSSKVSKFNYNQSSKHGKQEKWSYLQREQRSQHFSLASVDDHQKDFRNSRFRFKKDDYYQDFSSNSFQRSRSRSPRNEKSYSHSLKKEINSKKPESQPVRNQSNKNISVESSYKAPRVIERDLVMHKCFTSSDEEKIDFRCVETQSQSTIKTSQLQTSIKTSQSKPTIKQKKIDVTSSFDKETTKKNHRSESNQSTVITKYQNGLMNTGCDALEYQNNVMNTSGGNNENNLVISKRLCSEFSKQKLLNSEQSRVNKEFKSKEEFESEKQHVPSKTIATPLVGSVNSAETKSDSSVYKSLDYWRTHLKHEKLDRLTEMFLSKIIAKLGE
ncbi:protein TASOR isoform X4 [Hydra vulgaris]|uniref:Protein TASOR isoform X4 n=1 Tax=Hydra vulgaris TaxID=6087 RepID=A0ABM4D643_HYDVU